MLPLLAVRSVPRQIIPEKVRHYFAPVPCIIGTGHARPCLVVMTTFTVEINLCFLAALPKETYFDITHLGVEFCCLLSSPLGRARSWRRHLATTFVTSFSGGECHVISVAII